MPNSPNIVVIGGPNGAGKSTIARDVLVDALRVQEFVNADTIAAGLAAFNPESAAFSAGRVMLHRLRELADSRGDFAFESTLASRTFAPWLRRQIGLGYRIHIIYVMLKSPELAIRRVSKRVRAGGHAIPPETVVRRFHRSAFNLFGLYLPIAHTWRIYDNSTADPVLVATGDQFSPSKILSPRSWKHLNDSAAKATKDLE